MTAERTTWRRRSRSDTTAAEVIPVVKCDQRRIGDGEPGPVTLELIERFRSRTSVEGVRIPAPKAKKKTAGKPRRKTGAR